MKKIFLFVIILVLVLTGCTKEKIAQIELSPAEIKTNEDSTGQKLIFAIGEYKPYTSEFKEGYGFCSQIVTEAYKAVGIDVGYEFYPWPRAWESAVNQDVFGSFPWSESEERSKFTVTSDPIVNVEYKFLYLKDNYKIPKDYVSIESISGFNISSIEYNVCNEHLKLDGFNIDLASDETDGLIKLYNGRADLLVIDSKIVKPLVQETYPNEADKFVFLDRPYLVEQYHIHISKDYKDGLLYLEEFNKGLQILKENGKYKEILKKYDVENQGIE